MNLYACLREVPDRLGRPGVWLLLVQVPLLCLLLWFLGVDSAKDRAALVEMSAWATLAWPLGLLLLPSAWTGGRDGRVLASAWHGLARVALAVLALAPLVSLAAMSLAYESLEYYADHALGSFLLLFLLGATLSRGIAKGDLRARELDDRRRHLDRLEWMERSEPFSPALLTRLLDALADQALRDPRKSEEGLLALADLYKDWLRYGEELLGTLGGERELGERMAGLLRGCLPGTPDLVWDWDPKIDGRKVPSLFLQPLIEGSLGGRPCSAVLVQGRATQDGVQLEISLSCPEGNWPLIDVSVLQRRLRTALRPEARFQIHVKGDVWTAACSLPGDTP